MWKSVKNLFWSDNSRGNYGDESYQEKERDHDMSMECDQNVYNKRVLGKINEEGRQVTQNYFDNEYLDLIIDEGEESPDFNHLTAEDDYKKFKKLVEEAGIADLNSQSLQDRDTDKTVNSPLYHYKYASIGADDFKNEPQEDSEHDMGNESEGDCTSDMDDESVKIIEKEDDGTQASTHLSDKNADVIDSEDKSVQFMEIDQTTYHECSESYGDNVEYVSKNVDSAQYLSDILPDVSSDELSEDEQLDMVPKRSEELPKDETVTKKIDGMDFHSTLSDMLNLEKRNENITGRLPGMVPSSATDFKYENKLLKYIPEKIPSWETRDRNMPELEVMNESSQHLSLDDTEASRAKNIAVNDKKGGSGKQLVKNELISPAKSMPELENIEIIEIDSDSCDDNSLPDPDSGAVEDLQKDTHESSHSLPEKIPGDKGFTGELKETSGLDLIKSSSISLLQKHAVFAERKTKETKVSSLNINYKNEEFQKLAGLVYKPVVLNEDKELMFENFSTDQGKNCHESSLSGQVHSKDEEIKPNSMSFLPISSVVLKPDSSTHRKSQECSESSIFHGSVGKNATSNCCGTVESDDPLHTKEQTSAIENKVLIERATEMKAGSDSTTDVRNEQEPRSKRNLCQQSFHEDSKNYEERDANKSSSPSKIELKLNSVTKSTIPLLEMELENTSGNVKNQNELKTMCAKTKCKNHSETGDDSCESPKGILLQGTPTGKPSISRVEMKMENGVMRLSITPSGPEVESHVSGRGMSNRRACCNCLLVSKEEAETQTIFETESTRMQTQKTADHFQQKTGETGTLCDRFSASTSELGIQTIESPIVKSLDIMSDSQQISKLRVDKDKAILETRMNKTKELCKEAVLRVPGRASQSSSLSTNPLVSVAEIGTQVNEEWFYKSGSASGKSFGMKTERATQTSNLDSSGGQNAVTISDMQQILERIFGTYHQAKFPSSSKGNVETQTTAPPYFAPSSSLNQQEIASLNMNPVQFHRMSGNLCMLEGSDHLSESRCHCKCLIHAQNQSDISNLVPTSGSDCTQKNTTPNRGPQQIRKLLDVTRHSRLELNAVSPQAPKTASYQNKMLNLSQLAVECKDYSTDLRKSEQITVCGSQVTSSPYVNCIVTPTSYGGSGAKQATPVKVTPSGSKSNRKRPDRKYCNPKESLTLLKTLDNPGTSGINTTASPKKLLNSSNPVILVSCSCSTPISLDGRDLVFLGQRSHTRNPTTDAIKESTVIASERVFDETAKPVVQQYVDSPSKQNRTSSLDISLSDLKAILDKYSERKATLGSNVLADAHLGNSSKRDNDSEVVLHDKLSQQRVKQIGKIHFGPENEANISPSTSQTFSMSQKQIVNEACTDLEDVNHGLNLPTVLEHTEEQPGSKSNDIQKKVVKDGKAKETGTKLLEKEAPEHKTTKLNMVVRESYDETTTAGNTSKSSKLVSSKINSDRSEKRNKKNSSSNTMKNENSSPSACLRKREETSSRKLDKKKKIENASSKLKKELLTVSKTEQKLSSSKCSRKRKHPMNVSIDHGKKKKIENNLPRPAVLHQKKKNLRILRNNKEF